MASRLAVSCEPTPDMPGAVGRPETGPGDLGYLLEVDNHWAHEKICLRPGAIQVLLIEHNSHNSVITLLSNRQHQQKKYDARAKLIRLVGRGSVLLSVISKTFPFRRVFQKHSGERGRRNSPGSIVPSCFKPVEVLSPGRSQGVAWAEESPSGCVWASSRRAANEGSAPG